MWLKRLRKRLERRFFSNTERFRKNSYRILQDRICSLSEANAGRSLAIATIYDFPRDEAYIEYLFRYNDRVRRAIAKMSILRKKYK